MRFIISTLAAAILFTTAADAITYTASRPVGTGSVDLSITTDGTIGTLVTANIVDWTITVTQPAGTLTLFGPLSGGNSAVEIGGTAFSATATNLLFDYSATGFQYALFQLGSIGSANPFWCPQTNGCFDFDGPAEGLLAVGAFEEFSREPRQGLLVVASSGVIPEPATWAMLIAGFGLVGAALRRRTPAAA